jgi:hypothetical protein
MAKEMPVGLGGEPYWLTCPNRNGDPEATRTPRKCHPVPAVRPKRDVVAAPRQFDRTHIAIQAEQGGREVAAIVLPCGSEAFRRQGAERMFRQSQRGGSACKAYQERAAIDVHHASLRPLH